MVSRLLASVAAIVGFGVAKSMFNPVSTLIQGQAAGDQFANSDVAYLKTMAIFGFFNATDGVLGIGLLIVLGLIWFGVVKKFFVEATAVALLGLLMVGTPDKAFAFAETTDRTEAYTILPNESAFWVPDVGANKTSQVQLDSEDYLKENKLAAKRFIIPHAKFSGSGGWTGWDYYVPTGRLIIVDRTPYSREWVAQAHRGTSTTDQSFPCQSREGLNVGVGVSIGASVAEANAAKYLYRFGTKAPAGDRTDPKTIFTSVYYGRSLAEVMDDVGRKKVQTLVCDEINGRSLDKDNDEAVQIMDSVKKKATAYFEQVGITLDFIGWADTFTFDHEIQKAINDQYAANKLRDVVSVLTAVNQLKVQEGLGAGLAAKGLPMVLDTNMINTLIGLVKPVPVAPAPVGH